MSRFFLVVRDENENLLSTFLFNISILENGAMKKQLILEVDRDFSILNFRETFRDRELLPMSALSYNFRWCPFLDSRILRIFTIVVFFWSSNPHFPTIAQFWFSSMPGPGIVALRSSLFPFSWATPLASSWTSAGKHFVKEDVSIFACFKFVSV